MSRIILTHEVSGLGTAGDIVEVKNGYARNYLLPQGLAVAWSRGGQKQVEQIKAARETRLHATIEEAHELRAKLQTGLVELVVKAGSEGRLFGSVRPADIAAAVEAAGFGAIDKRRVELSAPIKTVGLHEATVTLRDGIVATISLKVVPAK